MSDSVNHFARLSAINVSEHIEKKGGFSYLSWPYAVSQLRLADPAACWEVRRFNDLPYLATDLGVFVEVAVTVQGVTLSQIHPVLDGRNRPIAAPTAFDINTSIQRCLVKAIALHGLGLYIYAGEDLPQVGSDPAANDAKPEPRPESAARLTTGKTINELQQRAIQRLVAETGTELPRVLEFYGVKSVAEIAVADFLRVVRSLEKRRAA
ncbi:MAG: DUF1071 domain-containing protein [Burkholderiales bacterium]|nr:DUF1071 domain-containing protein [Burkholderiales bacterium]MDE2160965.1 DUF1071 domain-containing protein [Burkholderiales bacterium]